MKAAPGEKILYEGETTQQYVRVVERPDGTRVLELNEGQAVHSLYRPGSYLTGGYWDGMLVLPFTALQRRPRKVAILGNAAGTTARAYGHFFPRAQVDGVEIDPKLEEIGRRYFDMGSNPNLTVHSEDARPWLRRSPGGYDVIVVDAYRQPYIPFYLATREFFELARDRLAPAGTVIVNVGHPRGQRRPRAGARADDGRGLSDRARDPIEQENTLLVASEAPVSARVACARRPSAAPAALRRLSRRPRVSSGRGSPAARSTPTTARRSSGWSTVRSSAEAGIAQARRAPRRRMNNATPAIARPAAPSSG